MLSALCKTGPSCITRLLCCCCYSPPHHEVRCRFQAAWPAVLMAEVRLAAATATWRLARPFSRACLAPRSPLGSRSGRSDTQHPASLASRLPSLAALASLETGTRGFFRGSRRRSVTSAAHFRNAEVTRLPAPSVSLFPVEESGDDDVQVGGPAAENRAASSGQGHLRGRGRGSVRGRRARGLGETGGRSAAATHGAPGLRRVPEAASWPAIGKPAVGAGPALGLAVSRGASGGARP